MICRGLHLALEKGCWLGYLELVVLPWFGCVEIVCFIPGEYYLVKVTGASKKKGSMLW